MDGTVGEVGSTLKIIDKSIVVIVLTLATVIFLPENVAKSTGIAKVRDEYFGFLWIGFIFSILYLIFITGKWFVKKRFSDSQELKVIATRSEQARLDRKTAFELDEVKKNASRQEQTRRYDLLFSALSEGELCWVRYCLIKSQMTVNTHSGNVTARSLQLKHLIVHGGGRMDYLPFSFQADAWAYLVANKTKFVPETNLETQQINNELKEFESSLPMNYL